MSQEFSDIVSGQNFDIREVIERFEEIEDSEDQDEKEESKKIQEFLDEVRGNGGDEHWRGEWYPVTFIAEDEFTDYAEEMVKDCEGLPRELPAYLEIDWEKTANNLKVDYTSVEVNGDTYLYR